MTDKMSEEEMMKEMEKEVEARVTRGVVKGTTILVTVGVSFVIMLVVLKFVWGWVVGDLFPGAVAQGLIAANLSWAATAKLALFVSALNGIYHTLVGAFETRM